MWLKRTGSIHPSKRADTLDASGLIHGLIGWEVSQRSPSWLEDEDIATFTTIHQAITYITAPMKTEKREKIG